MADGHAIEAVFRAANERVREMLEGLVHGGPMLVICECGDRQCFQMIELDRGEYGEIRHAGHFLLFRGHSDPDIERVVERRDGFDVVAKDLPAPI